MTTALPPLLLPLLPLLGAVLAPVAERWHPRGPGIVAAVATGSALLVALLAAPGIAAGNAQTFAIPWVPALGLELALRLDGLSLTFALLVVGIGLLVGLYARYYLPEETPRGGFHGLMLAFEASMLGLVLSDNLLLLVLCWELTSLLSFLLVAFEPEDRRARRGAGVALVVTAAGGLALLAAALLLGHVASSYRISDVLAAGAALHQDPLRTPIVLLILLAVFTKSAQVPFHAWLPAAMAAPTPVSAYLHSATLVKAGVFLLARLWPLLGSTDAWLILVSLVGLASFVFGAYVALFKNDLKGLLAYSTISHLGLIVFMFGLGSPLAAIAGLFHVLNHAVFKASLFMSVGIVDHETGTRDIRRLGGLMACLPITGTLALVAAAAMAGVPLLNGFLSKEMFFAEAADPPIAAAWPAALKTLMHILLPAAALLGGAFSAAYSLRFGHDVFFNGPPRTGRCPPHEPSWWMRLPVAALVALCVLVGLFPNQTVQPLLLMASRAMLGPLPEFHLAVWHGVSPALLMSAGALCVGVLIYVLRGPIFTWHERHLTRPRAERVYLRIAGWLVSAARELPARLGPATLPRSTAWLFATALAAGVLGWWAAGTGAGLFGSRAPLPVNVPALVAALILAASVLAMVRHPERRFAAVLYAGAIGLTVSLAFARFSAPDLALTQIAVEVVTALLLLAVLALLPSDAARTVAPGTAGSVPPRALRLAVAVGVGLGSAVLAAVLLLHPDNGSIATWYLAQAQPAAHAGNVVNAILVDFRALDTLGEITVLAMAGLAVHLLLDDTGAAPSRISRANAPPSDPDGAGRLLLRVLALLLPPAALLVAVFLLLRGHEAAGGGFVAGLVLATALVLDWLAWGVPTPPRGPRPVVLIGIGLALAWLTALAPLVLRHALLTSFHWQGRLPLGGEVSGGSTLVFDTGVLLVVAGTILAVFQRLAGPPAAATGDG